MLTDSFLEQEDTIRSQFAEAFFLFLRQRRYGIGPCKNCEDKSLLEARLQTIEWKKQKEKDEQL
jgi:hypothetical protein